MRRLAALSFLALLVPALGIAQATEWRESAQTIVHLLDYVGVDYPEFVRDGKVLDQAEYQEQLEFAAQAVMLLKVLPENPKRAQLIGAAQALAGLVAAKANGNQVTAAADNLRWAVVQAYRLSAVPKKPPDLALGKQRHLQHCAACHGAEGRGDGPAGKGLEPPPSDFHDTARMANRSVYGLYNTITLGVAGTGMASYKHLSEDERWALAFYVAGLTASETDLAMGEAAWKSGRYEKAFPDPANVAALSPDEVRARFGAEAVQAQRWLRAHPDALAVGQPSPIQFTLTTLRESYAAYLEGARGRAQQLAVTAYLEGFELVEASLDNVDAALRLEVEREMFVYRNLLRSGAPAEAVRAQMENLLALLEEAQARLASEGLSPGATFSAALVILLREGLEAVLVLAAIITFLVKSGRRDVLPWVHLGWAGALGLGVLTWLAATYAIDVSGSNREVTEGVTALIAAAVLIYVGLWLHSKTNAHAWQRFISERIGAALDRRTLWAIAAVSFLAVYRELFEIVLFYQALWAQAARAASAPLLGGAGAAAMLLAVLGWAIFHYGLRLPVGRFFAVTSILLAVLAVIFVGQGIAALQEAGTVNVDPVAFIRLPALGIFPTLQTLAAQGLVAALTTATFYLASRRRQGS